MYHKNVTLSLIYDEPEKLCTVCAKKNLLINFEVFQNTLERFFPSKKTKPTSSA